MITGRRQMLALLAAFFADPLMSLSGAGTARRCFSYHLYYRRSGIDGPAGTAEFISTVDDLNATVTASIDFPWSAQRLASIIPVPCPSIKKRYRYERNTRGETYTNDDGTFSIGDDGHDNLFMVAEESLGFIQSDFYGLAGTQIVRNDIFVTCDSRIGGKDETILNTEGQSFARVVRDIRIDFQGIHRLNGDDYLLVRAQPEGDTIPIIHTPLFDVGLMDISGFVRADGACPWVHMRIDNYFDVSGISVSTGNRIDGANVFESAFGKAVDGA